MPFQVLLPAAEKFFSFTAGGDIEAEEVKAFLGDGMDEKTLFAALPRPAQITKEGEEEFARLMADAAGDVKMFAVAGKEGRGEGEGFGDGLEFAALADKGRSKEEGEGKAFGDGGLALGGALVAGVEQAQGRFIRLIAGQKGRQELRLAGATQDSSGDAVAKEVLQLFAHPCRRRRGDQGGAAEDAIIGGRIEGEVEASGKFEGAQHPHRIFLVADQGVADHPDAPFGEIAQAADVVDDGKGFDVVEEGVDRKIAAEGVFLRGAEDILAKVMMVGGIFREIVGLGMAAEGGDLDDFAAKADVGKAEAAADEETVAEELFDLARSGIGRYIEIFRDAVQEEIAHTAADQVGLVVLAAQPIEDFQGLFVKLFAGNVMFGTRENNGQTGHNRRDSVKLAQTSRERTGIKEKSGRSRSGHKKSGPSRSAK